MEPDRPGFRGRDVVVRGIRGPDRERRRPGRTGGGHPVGTEMTQEAPDDLRVFDEGDLEAIECRGR
jgi:hypothetical protein